MAAVTICCDFGAQKNKVSHCFYCFPIYFPKVMGPDAMILVFWMLSFKPTFSLSSFTFIKRIFSSSSLYAIRVMLSVYLRLLICLLAILIPACYLSSLAFCMMYSTYKLNKQGDDIQTWHVPFPVWTGADCGSNQNSGVLIMTLVLKNSNHYLSLHWVMVSNIKDH